MTQIIAITNQNQVKMTLNYETETYAWLVDETKRGQARI